MVYIQLETSACLTKAADETSISCCDMQVKCGTVLWPVAHQELMSATLGGSCAPEYTLLSQ